MIVSLLWGVAGKKGKGYYQFCVPKASHFHFSFVDSLGKYIDLTLT